MIAFGPVNHGTADEPADDRALRFEEYVRTTRKHDPRLVADTDLERAWSDFQDTKPTTEPHEDES